MRYVGYPWSSIGIDGPAAPAILDRAMSGDRAEILFGLDGDQFLPHVVAQPRKRNRDVTSLEGPRQPAQHPPAVMSMAGTSEKSTTTVLIPGGALSNRSKIWRRIWSALK
jgi:hypothetical protein